MEFDLDKFAAGYVRRTPHMLDIGMAVTALSPGRGRMVLPARADWVGDPQRQVLHPGVLTVLADSACGLAVGAALQRRLPYATLDLRMDYLRPAGPDADLHCEAHCYRLTRSVAFIRAEVWQADQASPIATAQATFMLATPPGSPLAKPGARAAETAPATAGAKATASPAAEPAAPQPLPADNNNNNNNISSSPGAHPAEGGSATTASALAPGWQPAAARRPMGLQPPIPYVDYLAMGLSDEADGQPLYRLPHHARLIGNPYLPALHGGVVAGFSESAAMLHLHALYQGSKLPKGIDFAIDYLRPGRPEETFAACELVRVGGRVALVQVRCWQSAGPSKPITVSRGHFLMAAA